MSALPLYNAPPSSPGRRARAAALPCTGAFCIGNALHTRVHEPHTKKPDLDNLTKQLKDAMTRLQFWSDDRQVVRIACEKRYGEQGRWEVCVREVLKTELS